jgi:hypothetical protein
MDHNFERNIILAQATEEAIEKAQAILSEFFQHFALVVQYDDGSVMHVSDNSLVEKALYREALDMIREDKEFEDCELEDCEIDWDDDDDSDDSWAQDGEQ